jgi:hypothetical protein
VSPTGIVIGVGCREVKEWGKEVEEIKRYMRRCMVM